MGIFGLAAGGGGLRSWPGPVVVVASSGAAVVVFVLAAGGPPILAGVELAGATSSIWPGWSWTGRRLRSWPGPVVVVVELAARGRWSP